MNAHTGDRLVIKAHHTGEHDREAEIVAVRGDAGGPPYLVRWQDDGHQSLIFPGSDAVVVPVHHRRKAARAPAG